MSQAIFCGIASPTGFCQTSVVKITPFANRFVRQLVGACLLAGVIVRAADSSPAPTAISTSTTTPAPVVSTPAAAPASSTSTPPAASKPNTAIIAVPQRTEDGLPQSAVTAYEREHAAYAALAKAGGIDLTHTN
jgi:hypothetical protein